MTISKTVFGILSAAINLFCVNVVYCKISNDIECQSKAKYILFLIIISTFIYLNNVYNVNESTFLLQLFFLMIFNKITSKDTLGNTFIKTTYIFVLIAIIEIILTIFLLLFHIDVTQLSDNYFLKTIFSIVDIGLVYLISAKFTFSKKIISWFEKISKKYETFIILIVIVILGIMSYKNLVSYSNPKEYLSNIILLIILMIIVSNIFIEKENNSIEKEKTKSLIKSMEKYEELIDQQRINRHELLNHLLTLKSIKNKNTKEFETQLNELISQNQNNELSGLHSIYNLPSGLKGMFYYKIYQMKSEGIDVFINIDKKTISMFDNLKEEYYVEVCRMIGIFLDNAREASIKSKEKNVVIDSYKEDNKLVIYIENTFKGKVDVENINEKNFSSKGKGRGLGLFVVKNLISKRNCYELTQKVNNNRFITILKVDKEKTSK